MDIPTLNSSMMPAGKPMGGAKNTSLGDELNQMGGMQTEKSLYAEKKDMGKDAFLKMFMEQLKNQDPMNPAKNDQFSQQMAMFSQLEQQVNMNKNLEKIIAQQSNTQIAALQLVGKNVLADRGAIYHDKDKPSSVTFKLPQDASELKMDIIDPAGDVVRSYNIGGRSQGDVTWRWDGNKEGGQPVEGGRYSYKIQAKGLDGKEIAMNTKVEGRVTGVTSSNGAVFLLVGEQRISLNDVETIKDPSAPNQLDGKAAPNMPAPMGMSSADMAKMVTPNNANDKATEKALQKIGEEASDKAELAEPKIGDNPMAQAAEAADGDTPGDRLNPMMPIYMR